MKFPPGEPKASDNSPAIVHAELSLTFKAKQQLYTFIKLLLNEQARPCFSVETSDDEQFTVIVRDICWGANLVRIAKIAANVDYNAGQDVN